MEGKVWKSNSDCYHIRILLCCCVGGIFLEFSFLLVFSLISVSISIHRPGGAKRDEKSDQKDDPKKTEDKDEKEKKDKDDQKSGSSDQPKTVKSGNLAVVFFNTVKDTLM